MALVTKNIVKTAAPSGPAGMPVGSAPGGGTIINDPTAPGGTRIVYGSFPIGGGSSGYLIPPDKPGSTGEQKPSIYYTPNEAQKASIQRAETFLQNQLKDKLQRLQEGKIRAFDVPYWFQDIGNKRIDAGNVQSLFKSGVNEAAKTEIQTSKVLYSAQPEIYQKVVEVREGTPIIETRYRDVASGIDRLATSEERAYIERQPREGGYPEGKVPLRYSASPVLRATGGIASSAVSTVRGLASIPSMLRYRQPSTDIKGKIENIKKISSSASLAGEKLGKIIASEPAYATGYVAAEIATSYGLGMALKPFITPKITKMIPGYEQTISMEKIKPFITLEGKEIERSEYLIKTVRTAPQVEITTKLRKFIGLPPIRSLEETSKPYISITRTIGPSEIGKPFGVIEVRPRSKELKLISGVSEEVSAFNLKTPIDKKLLGYFGDLNKAGTLSVSEITSETLLKGPRRGEWILPKPGRRTSISKSLTETVSIKETETYSTFVSRTAFKDISKPFPRARGRITSLETAGIRINLPPENKVLDITDITPSEYKADITPVLKTKKAFGLFKVMPKQRPISLTSTMRKQLKSPRLKYINIPSQSFKGSDKKLISLPTLSTKSISMEKSITKELNLTKPRLLSSPLYQLKETSKLIEKMKDKEILKEKGMFKIKEMSKLIPREKLKTSFKLKSILKPKLSIIPKPKTSKFTFRKPVSPKGFFNIDLSDKSLLGFGKSYSVFKIRKRKPVKVAEGLTRAAALDIGAAVTMKDLTATFGIKESLAPLRGIETGREFSRFRDLFREPAAGSKYRKYGTVFVQRRTKVGNLGGRLAFPGEKLAIRRARLNKIMGAIR